MPDWRKTSTSRVRSEQLHTKPWKNMHMTSYEAVPVHEKSVRVFFFRLGDNLETQVSKSVILIMKRYLFGEQHWAIELSSTRRKNVKFN